MIQRKYQTETGMHSFNTYQEMLSKFDMFNSSYSFRWRKTQQQGKLVIARADVPSLIKAKRNLSWSSRGRKVKGVELIYDGIPYVIVGREFYTCHQGPDVDKLQKKKKKQMEERKIMQDPTYSIKRRKNYQTTKKKGCPASVEMLHIIKLLSFQIPSDSRWGRTQVSQKFHAELLQCSEEEILNWELRNEYHIQLPAVFEHVGHPVIRLAPKCQISLDVKIPNIKFSETNYRSKMDEHATSNHTTPELTDQWLLQNVEVTDALPGLEILNSVDITSQSIEERCSEWISNEDKYILRKSSFPEEPIKQNFLFIYQSEWQQRLLSLYGSEASFIDVGHRAFRFALPTYFLRVKTNVCHNVVGFFICENDDTDSIQEALSVIASWNKTWIPKYFLIDHELLTTFAVQKIFPCCSVYVSDFHRENAWTKWLSNEENGLTEFKGEVLKLLRAVARSSSSSNFNAAKKLLKQSKWWNNHPNFAEYYTTIWQPIEDKWVPYFQDEASSILVLNRIGFEKEHDWIKQDIFPDEVSVIELIDSLINVICPKNYKKYVELNIHSSEGYKKYHESVPMFLRNRPRYLVDHIMKRLPISSTIDDYITQVSSTEFVVRRNPGATEYHVFFGSGEQMPYCSCGDWTKFKLPCRHLVEILLQKAGFSWDSFCPKYRESPFFNLDLNIFESSELDIDNTGGYNNPCGLTTVNKTKTPKTCAHSSTDGDYIITILPKGEIPSPPLLCKTDLLMKWKLIFDKINSLDDNDNKLKKLDSHFNNILSYVEETVNL